MNAIKITKPKLACFIHSTTMPLWKDSFLIIILERLKNAGLLSKLEHLCIVNTGLELNVTHIESKYFPAKIIQYSKETSEFENPTIRQLYGFCKLHPDYKVLYMHTKGISYKKDHVFLKGIHSWNSYMMHCLIDSFPYCVSLMTIYDTVGCNFRPFESGNGQHYSGNYWWANARYINKLPIDYLKNKYDPEFWLLQKEPLFFNIHTIEHMYEQEYPLINYQESVKEGFMNNILFCKVGFPRTGLCNQLYCITNVICIAASQVGDKIIILDDFINDIHTLNVTPTPFVLDLEKVNHFLSIFNIKCVYKNNVELTVNKIEYGLKHVKILDITENIMKHFWKEKHLFIPKGVSLNDYTDCDPCPQMRKQIYVTYTINDVQFEKTFHERNIVHFNPLEIKHSNYDGKPVGYVDSLDKPWLTRINRDDSKDLKPLFDIFLKQLHFHSSFYGHAEEFINTIIPDREDVTINVIHLRNEQDAISHWAKLNNLSENEYRQLYETKLIETVHQYFQKADKTIFLTSFVDNNPVIEQLREEGYECFVKENNEKLGREMNGIVDLLIGQYCNQYFIGNLDTHTWQGSTFSFVLYNQLKDTNVSSIFIDIDHIDRDVVKISENDIVTL